MTGKVETLTQRSTTSILEIQQVCENCAVRVAKQLKGKAENVRFAFGKQYGGNHRFEVSFDVMPKGVQIKYDYEQGDKEPLIDFIDRVFNKLGA